MPKPVLAAALLVILGAAAQGARAGGESTRAFAEATVWQKQTLHKLQKRSHYMQRVMHASLTSIDPKVKRRVQSASTPRERDHILIAHWKRVYTSTSADYRNPPFLRALTCIHHGEGAWDDMRNPSYDGGLQMDVTFQQRYGGFLLRLKGRAYNWTPLEQIWTAVYAIRGPDHRGFSPWPATARACDLI